MSDPTLQAELAKIDSIMQIFAKAKGVPIGKVVRNASRDFTRYVYAKTPPSKPNKDWTQVPGRGSSSDRKIWLHKYGSGFANVSGSINWRGPWKIKNRNFTRVSWVGAMIGLGMSTKKRSMTKGGGNKGYRVLHESMAAQQGMGGDKPSVKIINQMKLVVQSSGSNNFVSGGLKKAFENMQKQLNKHLEKAGF